MFARRCCPPFHDLRFFLLSCDGIGVSEVAQDHRGATDLAGLAKLCNGLVMHPLGPVGYAEAPTSRGEVGIELETPSAVLDGLVVLAGAVSADTGGGVDHGVAEISDAWR